VVDLAIHDGLVLDDLTVVATGMASHNLPAVPGQEVGCPCGSGPIWA
jgi:hypothetical protein